MPQVDVTEKHFTVLELAELWNLHTNTIRKLFERVPDAVRITMPTVGKDGKRKRSYTTLRIPQSVAERVMRGLRGLGPQQVVTVTKPAPKPLVDPSLTGLERRQAEMKLRNRKGRH